MVQEAAVPVVIQLSKYCPICSPVVFNGACPPIGIVKAPGLDGSAAPAPSDVSVKLEPIAQLVVLALESVQVVELIVCSNSAPVPELEATA
jgi:hypothetical protein